MKTAKGLKFAMLLLLGSLGAISAEPPLRLVRTIPLSQLTTKGTPAFKAENFSNQECFGHQPNPAVFGFIRKGTAVCFGYGGWVFDLKRNELSREFPEDFTCKNISMDGTLIDGYLFKGPGNPFKYVHYDTVTGTQIERPSAEAYHPDNVTYAKNGRIGLEPGEKGFLYSVKIINAAGKADEISNGGRNKLSFGAISGFSKDGRFLIVWQPFNQWRFIEVTHHRLLPLDPEFDPNKSSSENYIGDSDRFVFNRDVSWVAGKKGANDWSTFVWDRIHKRFLWKDTMVSEPSAFSPNNKFIYCCDAVVVASTGKALFENLKGIQGKFSPDGYSLVTVDKDAFYIYTLPKDSEPIFGVFQAPQPWSPPGAVKPTKAPVKKP